MCPNVSQRVALHLHAGMMRHKTSTVHTDIVCVNM
jgi:hypothetical protein